MGKIGTRTLVRRVQELERQLSLAMQLGQITITAPDDQTKQVSWQVLYNAMKAATPAHRQAVGVKAELVSEPPPIS